MALQTDLNPTTAQDAACDVRGWVVLIAFAALAVLAGPVNAYFRTALVFAANAQALAAALAGAAMLGLAVVLGQHRLRAIQRRALLLLLIPQWAAIALSEAELPSRWLHEPGWGTVLLLSVAAPLWLALLAALDLVEVHVPRAVAGAAIAGIGAICLLIPISAYDVSLRHIPMLSVQVLLNIAIVASWAYAVPRLSGFVTLMTAGSYLLLSGAGDGLLTLVLQRGVWQPLDWNSAWAPLLAQAAVTAVVWWLWFWLLKRMPLSAFAMGALAAWLAAVLPGLTLLSLFQWRVDAALGIAFGALVIALRASPEEQPTALGLSAS